MGLVSRMVCETGIVPWYCKMGPAGEVSFTYKHNVYLILDEEEFKLVVMVLQSVCIPQCDT